MKRKAKKVWTRENIEDLKRLYPYRYNDELSEIFHRSAGAIAVKANKLGLKKEASLIRAMGFQKGYTPFNKGKKMSSWLSPEVLQKIKDNQARTAERNKQQARPDGSMTIRQDGPYIKVSGYWKKYAHHIWEQNYGPIPLECAVYFKDGDKTNCDPTNLVLGRKADPTFILQMKSPQERIKIRQKQNKTRQRNLAEAMKRKNEVLTVLLLHIRKSNNDLSYKIPSSIFNF